MLYISKQEDINLKKEGLSICYFYSPSSPYHPVFCRKIEKLEEKYPRITFYAIDAEQFPHLLTKYNLHFMPSMRFLYDGVKRLKLDKWHDICLFEGEIESYIVNGECYITNRHYSTKGENNGTTRKNG